MAAAFTTMSPAWRELSPSRKIDAQRQGYNQPSWGLVVYRCTYGHDDAWLRFEDILRQRVERGLAADNNAGMMETFNLIVMSDETAYGQASADDIRDHFRAWCQRTLTGGETLPPSEIPPTPQYQYCLLVDTDSLNAVLSGPPPEQPDVKGHGWVNIIDARWNVWGPIREDVRKDDDGSADCDIGYMRVSLFILVPTVYSWLCDEAMWEVNYCRPPVVLRR